MMGIMNTPPENKYAKWVFTIMDPEREAQTKFPGHTDLKEALESMSDRFVFQIEKCPKTSRLHYQGCFVTRIRKRQSTILIDLSVRLQFDVRFITIDRMQGTWNQAVEYCSKSETQTQFTIYSDELKEEQSKEYTGKDLDVFSRDFFYSWQFEVLDIIFEDDHETIRSSSSRQVYWITDVAGNSGKSLFTKYLCWKNSEITKIAFGSGSQMRASIVEEGSKKCYIIDIPRQLCNDDHLNNIYSVIEDCKNGFLKSSMYGKPKVLFMEPPIVIIFSNSSCPTEKLSVDRWKICSIINKQLYGLEGLDI